jgi:hypothetical protein
MMENGGPKNVEVFFGLRGKRLNAGKREPANKNKNTVIRHFCKLQISYTGLGDLLSDSILE